MIILDTNVVSELMKPRPNDAVIDWLDAQTPGSVAVTAVTVAEVFYGIRRMPEGRRKNDFEVAASAMFESDLNIILPFDAAAATDYAVLVAERERVGRPITSADGQIASICSSNDATLATRNTQDFTGMGIELINPWGAG